MHAAFLDGAYRAEAEDALGLHALSHLTTRDVAAAAASGEAPAAGPEWRRRALPPLSLTQREVVFERPLSVALDGFTLHAATRADGLDDEGREALLRYILRPAVAQERVTRGGDGVVRVGLKKAFSDGTVRSTSIRSRSSSRSSRPKAYARARGRTMKT